MSNIISFEDRKREKAIADINLIDQECEYQENMKVRKALKALGQEHLIDDGIDYTLSDKMHSEVSAEYEAACDRMFEAVMEELEALDFSDAEVIDY